MSDLSLIERVDSSTRSVSRFNVDTILRRDARNWPGIHFEHWKFHPRELEEHYLHAHVVALHLQSSPCEVRWAGRPWKAEPMEPSVAFIVPAEMPRAARWRSVNEVLCLAIAPEHLSSVTHFMRRIELQQRVASDSFITQTMFALARDLDGGCRNGPLYGESLTTALIVHLACAQGNESAESTHSGLSRFDLQRVLDYVEANLERVMTLSELAELVSMNKFRFLRAFSQALHMPPYRYCLLRRLERAKQLLRDTEHSLSEVALRTGFSSQSHFGTAFRSYTGVSPRIFREGNR